jgi:hypothetical protein
MGELEFPHRRQSIGFGRLIAVQEELEFLG